MITSQKEYNSFVKETNVDCLLISVIPSDDRNIHASATKPIAILIRDLNIDKTYTISLGHPDCLFSPNRNDLINNLQKRHHIWAFDKKSITQLFPINNLHDVDLWTHLKDNWIINIDAYDTAAHKLIKRNNHNQRNINTLIPLLKHKEMFDKMCDEEMIRTSGFYVSMDGGFIKEDKWILETLAELESTGIHVNPICFRNHFPNATIHESDMVYSQYNVYTSTGRPSNRFDGVNYAALNKSDGSRKCFTSRFGEDGKMVLVDFSAFHPRIISYLIKFPLDIGINIYEYLGELYFNRKVTEYDMDEIKSITMRQFYGGVEEKYQHIKYLSHARDFIEKYWHDFKKNGFIKTPVFKRVITDKHLIDPNPPKVLNYILQATETEIATMILRDIQKFLKFYKTKAVLYTYDSILFDFYKLEQEEIFKPLLNIMRMKDKFPIKVYEGNTYDDVIQINV